MKKNIDRKNVAREINEAAKLYKQILSVKDSCMFSTTDIYKFSSKQKISDI